MNDPIRRDYLTLVAARSAGLIITLVILAAFGLGVVLGGVLF